MGKIGVKNYIGVPLLRVAPMSLVSRCASVKRVSREAGRLTNKQIDRQA